MNPSISTSFNSQNLDDRFNRTAISSIAVDVFNTNPIKSRYGDPLLVGRSGHPDSLAFFWKLNNKMSNSDSDRKLPKKRSNKYPPAGITLEMMIRALVEEYGWAELGQKIFIRCFNDNPSLKSSLIFLKQTEWARLQVEDLYYWRFGGRPADWVGPAPRDDGDYNDE